MFLKGKGTMIVVAVLLFLNLCFHLGGIFQTRGNAAEVKQLEETQRTAQQQQRSEADALRRDLSKLRQEHEELAQDLKELKQALRQRFNRKSVFDD